MTLVFGEHLPTAHIYVDGLGCRWLLWREPQCVACRRWKP